MPSLKENLNTLMDDDTFVDATINAVAKTKESGCEWEYRVVRSDDGCENIIGPNIAGKNSGYFEDVDGEAVYLAHTHPTDNIPQPSQHDLDMINIRMGMPIGAVWANDDGYASGVAFRRSEPLVGLNRCVAVARKVANSLLYMAGISYTGFTSTSYRRYESTLRRNFREAETGRMEYIDVVPDALVQAGFEAAAVGIKKKYRGN